MKSKAIDCSFCGKSQHEVAKIIAGPSDIFICNECISLCQEIISPEDKEKRRRWAIEQAQPLANGDHEQLFEVALLIEKFVVATPTSIVKEHTNASDA